MTPLHVFELILIIMVTIALSMVCYISCVSIPCLLHKILSKNDRRDALLPTQQLRSCENDSGEGATSLK